MVSKYRPFSNNQLFDISTLCQCSIEYAEKSLDVISNNSDMKINDIFEKVKFVICNSDGDIDSFNNMCEFALTIDIDYKFTSEFFDIVTCLLSDSCSSENAIYLLTCFVKKPTGI